MFNVTSRRTVFIRL